ncbi:LacI family DNA-binding transcriptional regulator [Vibrio astriarenae]
MKATIKDVAKNANVSISTVSYALNGGDKVRKDTRARIIDVAKELGYYPERVKKLTQSNNNKCVGLFFNSWYGPVYSKVVKGIEKQLHAKGYDVMALSLSNQESGTLERYLNNDYIDGAIVLSSEIPDEVIINRASEQLPFVVLDREIHSDNVYSLLIDNFGGSFLAVKELINSGESEVYFFSGPENSYDSQKRLAGYLSALGYFNVSIKKEYIINAEFEDETAFEKADQLFKRTTPKAIFSSNDEMAIGIIRAANKHNISIPTDMRLVGFDDIQMANLIVPRLTTVCHDKYKMGVQAATLVLDAINGEKGLDSMRMLQAELIRRETF